MSTQFANQFVEQPPQWANFIDITDVKSYLQIPSADTTRDQLLQDYVDDACWWIQDYIGRPIGETTFFRRFDGWSGYSGAFVELPYYPVLSVLAFVEWWGSNGPQVLTQQIPENQAGGAQVYQLDALRGRLTRSFAGLVARPTFPGLGNLEVLWTAGYQPVPPPLRKAARELVKYWWTNEQQASRSFAAGGRQDYGGDIDPHNTLFPLVPNRVASLIETYTQYGIA